MISRIKIKKNIILHLDIIKRIEVMKKRKYLEMRFFSWLMKYLLIGGEVL